MNDLQKIFSVSSTHISAYHMINQTFADIVNPDVVNSLVDNQFSFEYELSLVKSVKEQFNYLKDQMMNKKQLVNQKVETEDHKENSSSLTEPIRSQQKEIKNKKYFNHNKYLSKTKKFSDVYGFKTRSDCLRKRFKTQIHSFILKKLNASVKEEDLYFFKLPSVFSTNLNHDFNISLINMTLKELFSFDVTSKQYDKLRVEHNKALMNKPSSNEAFLKLKEKKWIELYYEYIFSPEFSNYMAILRAKYGNEMSHLYSTSVKTYTDFYLKSSLNS